MLKCYLLYVVYFSSYLYKLNFCKQYFIEFKYIYTYTNFTKIKIYHFLIKYNFMLNYIPKFHNNVHFWYY